MNQITPPKRGMWPRTIAMLSLVEPSRMSVDEMRRYVAATPKSSVHRGQVQEALAAMERAS